MKVGPAFFPQPIAVTLNPSDKASEISLSDGNRVATRSTSVNTHALVRATAAKSSGKWYFEIYVSSTVGSAGGDYSAYGIAQSGLGLNSFVGSSATSYGYDHATGNKWNNNSGSAYGASLANTNVMGVAVDLDNGKIWFAKNNTWQASGDPAAGTNAAFTGLSGTFYPAVSLYKTPTTQHVLGARFPSADLSYSPPSGFSPWSSP